MVRVYHSPKPVLINLIDLKLCMIIWARNRGRKVIWETCVELHGDKVVKLENEDNTLRFMY